MIVALAGDNASMLFETFVKLHVAVVPCLQQILDDGPQKWSRESITSTDGNGILTAIVNRIH